MDILGKMRNFLRKKSFFCTRAGNNFGWMLERWRRSPKTSLQL